MFPVVVTVLVYIYTLCDETSSQCLSPVQEKELKLAADAVLSEVRKKQADTKRIQDILKSLEKLRKLRKEAAARRGEAIQKASQQPY